MGGDATNGQGGMKELWIGIGAIVVVLVMALVVILLVRSCSADKSYQITFDSNGGSAVNSIMVDRDGTIIRPEDPTRDGYTFIGWYLDGEPFDFTTKVTKEMTLRAKWGKVGVEVESVRLDATEITLEAGSTRQLRAIITPNDAENQEVTWSSSDTSVVTVDRNGVVTAVKAGTATITVKTSDGSYTATCTVTVTKKADQTVAGNNGSNNNSGNNNQSGGNNSQGSGNKGEDKKDDDTPKNPEYVTVTFVYGNGDPNTTVQVEKGKKVSKPTTNPTRDGYTFEGWDFNFDTPVNSNVTINAQWKKVEVVEDTYTYSVAEAGSDSVSPSYDVIIKIYRNGQEITDSATLSTVGLYSSTGTYLGGWKSGYSLVLVNRGETYKISQIYINGKPYNITKQ